MKDKECIIRRMDDLGRIVIPKQLRKEVLGGISIWEMDGKSFSIEKVYSADYKQWGFLILPVAEEDK